MEGKQHLDSVRQKDALRGVESTEISVRLGNYFASYFEGSAHSPLPTSVSSAYPHSWEGATLVAPAIRLVLACWPDLPRLTHHDGTSPVNFCRRERSTVLCVSLSTTS
jgi:hypothetical protein